MVPREATRRPPSVAQVRSCFPTYCRAARMAEQQEEDPAQACGCSCDSHISLEVRGELAAEFQQCQCRLCGPGRCAQWLHPFNFMFRCLERMGSAGAPLEMPFLCADCGEHFLLQRRREAVRRSRRKRQTENELAGGTEHTDKRQKVEKSN